MASSSRTLRQVKIEMPAVRPSPPLAVRLAWRVLGTVLAPSSALLAVVIGAPGAEFHLAIMRMALRWLWADRVPGLRRWLLGVLACPMQLTRYEEFDFAWRHVPGTARTYLDVSSPALFPLRVVDHLAQMQAVLINPHPPDLALTQQMVDAGALGDRCTTLATALGQFSAAAESYDLVTSLSVIEHIPANREAVERLWRLLKPGGTLILTVPCAASAYELHTSQDHYGLLEADASGHAFLQFVYDDQLLTEFVFSVTGPPCAVEIYGESRPGFLRGELLRRWAGCRIDSWKEPWLMAREFRRFGSVAELPGEGVACMAFRKG